MWTDLPLDVLSKIFSFLEPDSLACASSTCRHWHKCTKTRPLPLASRMSPRRRASEWFVALPTRSSNANCLSCYTRNPVAENWRSISTDFLPCPVRPLASTRSLVLFRPATTSPASLELLACNPFTREFKKLPPLNSPRANPAIAVVESEGGFRVYVAGGARGSGYEPALEVYDSARGGAWRVAGSVPQEIAVRLTVWTPGEGAWCGGAVYWITSARAYSLVRCGVSSNTWRTMRAPMAERLEFAAVVVRRGRVAVVGGACGGEARVWELGERDDEWVLVAEVPSELGSRLVGERESWANTKCASCEGMVCLYGSLGSGMVVWKEVGDEGKWDWFWVDGCRFLGGKRVPDFHIKGVFLHPTLSSSTLFT